MDDNIIAQTDEIEALSSIYLDEWAIVDEPTRSYEIGIKPSAGLLSSNEHMVVLKVQLPSYYPSDGPPLYEISAPWLRGPARQDLIQVIDDVYSENIGQSVIYQMIEQIREYLTNLIEKGMSGSAQNVEVEDDTHVDAHAHLAVLPKKTSNVSLPEIFHGDTFEDRNSIFQAHLANISHIDQVDIVLDKLKENKKIAAATHNIFAYRIAEDAPRSAMNEGSEDDGEIRAGNRLLHLLQIIDAKNVLVIVTRWYGGVHLGADRFKHINNLARLLLEQRGFTKNRDETKNKTKTKKKD